MARIITIQLQLTDADCAVFDPLDAAGRTSFLLVKLAAMAGGRMQDALTDSETVGRLSEADQAAVQPMVAAATAAKEVAVLNAAVPVSGKAVFK